MKATAIPITANIGIRTVKSVNIDGSIAFARVIADSFKPVALYATKIVFPEIAINPRPNGKIKAMTIKLTAIVIICLTFIPNLISLPNFNFNKNKKNVKFNRFL